MRPPERGARGGQREHGPRDERGEVGEHLERGDVGVDGALRARGAARGVRGAERAARAQDVGAEPEQRDRREGEQEHAERLLPGSPQAQRVEAEEGPRLRPQQRCRDQQPECGPRTPVEVRHDRPHRCCHEEPLGVPERRVEEPPAAQRDREHGGGGRRGRCGRGTRARRDEAVRERGGAGEREQPARARHDEPERRRGLPGSREHGRRDDRERLPRRSAGGVELEPRDVPPPADPRPRVERERPRQQQGQRGEGEAAGDEPGRARPAVRQR